MKTQNRILVTVALMLALISGTSASAQSRVKGPSGSEKAGGGKLLDKGGGGGHILKTAFKMRAAELVLMVENSPEASELCPADVMRTGLSSVTLDIVNQIRRIPSGEPISTGKYQAWVEGGKLQLLEKAWTQRLIEDRKEGQSPSDRLSAIDGLILHEIYRTTENICPDEIDERSTKALEVLRNRNIYMKWFELEPYDGKYDSHDYNAQDYKTKNFSGTSFCDREQNCIWVHVTYPDLTFSFRGVTKMFQNKVSSKNFGHSMQSNTTYAHLSTIGKLMSKGQKLHLVIDLETGAWAYGLNPNKLTRIP